MQLSLVRGAQIYFIDVRYWEEEDTNACEMEIGEVTLDGKIVDSLDLTAEEHERLLRRAQTYYLESDDIDD